MIGFFLEGKDYKIILMEAHPRDKHYNAVKTTFWSN